MFDLRLFDSIEPHSFAKCANEWATRHRKARKCLLSPSSEPGTDGGWPTHAFCAMCAVREMCGPGSICGFSTVSNPTHSQSAQMSGALASRKREPDYRGLRVGNTIM